MVISKFGAVLFSGLNAHICFNTNTLRSFLSSRLQSVRWVFSKSKASPLILAHSVL